MPKLTNEQKTSRRKQIMQAALICAARKGFHQTSMRDICREANMSIGAVYNYFKSKEEILAAMTREGRQAKREVLERLKECRNARESLQELFGYFFLVFKNDSFRTYGAIDLETYCEAMRNQKVRKIMREEYESLANPLLELIRHWQRKKEIRKDIDPSYLANYLISLSVGIKIHLLVQPDLSVDGFEDIVQKTFLESIWQELKNGQSE
jgi:AcrR family transcriptional regulator